MIIRISICTFITTLILLALTSPAVNADISFPSTTGIYAGGIMGGWGEVTSTDGLITASLGQYGTQDNNTFYSLTANDKSNSTSPTQFAASDLNGTTVNATKIVIDLDGYSISGPNAEINIYINGKNVKTITSGNEFSSQYNIPANSSFGIQAFAGAGSSVQIREAFAGVGTQSAVPIPASGWLAGSGLAIIFLKRRYFG